MHHVIFILLSLMSIVNCLDNGLAHTPPMGWMTWQRFRCQTDCHLYPEDCISEHLIRSTAEQLATNGYREAGYQYVIIDDCWPQKTRDPQTQELVPDPIRFPNGMKQLGDYVHSLGLKFGIYLDYGTLTCEAYPGSMYHLKTDASTLASWGTDYIKMDGCYAKPSDMPDGFEEFSKCLNETGRPIVFSCSYPAYTKWQANESLIDWKRLQSSCNLWRILGDVQDSWTSVVGIIEAYKSKSTLLADIAGPGHWNDPDMLLLGNFGLSMNQQRVQMGMWCMFAAPLLISTKMEDINHVSADLLKNKYLIKINQDVGGHQAEYVTMRYGVQLWSRTLESDPKGWAIAFFYTMGGGGPINFAATLKDFGIYSKHLCSSDLFELTDVFNGSVFRQVKANETFIARVNPTGIMMYRVAVVNKTTA